MPTPALDIVFFDVDDTLYSTTAFAEGARRAAIGAMVDAGLRIDVDDGVGELAEVVGEFASNYDGHFDRLLDRLGPESYAGFNRAVIVAAGVVGYHNLKVNGLHMLPDVRVVLEALRGAVRVGIITAGLQVKQAEKLIRLGALPYLDPTVIYFSDQVGVSKPNPKLFSLVCQRSEVDPARALYVGDRHLHDILPARAAGMPTVHYTGAGGKYASVCGDEPADHVLDDMRPLVGILRDTYGLPV